MHEMHGCIACSSEAVTYLVEIMPITMWSVRLSSAVLPQGAIILLMSGMLCRPLPLPKLQPLLLLQQHVTLRLPLQVRCLTYSFCACNSDLQNTL